MIDFTIKAIDLALRQLSVEFYQLGAPELRVTSNICDLCTEEGESIFVLDQKGRAIKLNEPLAKDLLTLYGERYYGGPFDRSLARVAIKHATVDPSALVDVRSQMADLRTRLEELWQSTHQAQERVQELEKSSVAVREELQHMEASSVLARLKTLEANAVHRDERLHDLAEEFDTFVKTPWWKRLWFVINGWPLYRLVDHPQRRPWHRFTGW